MAYQKPTSATVPSESILTSRWLKIVIGATQLVFWFGFRLCTLFCVSRKTIYFDRIDIPDRLLIAANHQRALDPFIILASLPLKTYAELLPYRFFAKNSLYNSKLLRPLLYLFGCFPAYPHTKLPYGLFAAELFINDGQTVFIFPEGKRTKKRHPAQKPRNGVAALVAATNCQIAPAKIRWQGNNCQIVFGKPWPAKNMSSSQIMETIYKLN